MGARLLGLDRMDLSGLHFEGFVAESTRPVFDACLAGAFNAKPTPSCELQLIRSDQTLFTVQIECNLSADGQECRLVAIDITQHKRAEERLRLFKSVIETSQEAISITDELGKFVYINPAHEKLFGHTLAEVQPLNYRVYCPPETLGKIDKIVMPAQASGAGWNGELDVFDTNGRLFSLSGRVNALFDDNGSIKFSFAIMHDITERKQVENSLRENEHMYHAMFEKNLAVKLLIDPLDGAIVDANSAAAGFYGYSVTELKGMKISNINTLPNAQIQAEMAQAVAEQRLYFQFQHRLAHGELREVEVYSSPIELGGRTLLHSIIHDITRRKKVEMALLESEDKYQQLFRNSTDGIALFDERGHVIEWNPAMERMSGWERTQVLGMDFMEIQLKLIGGYVSPEILEHQKKMMKQALETGEAPILNTILEFSYKPADGKARFGQQSVYSIKTQRGFRIGILARDITDHKTAEEAMKQSEAHYHLLADHMTDVIWLRDLDLNLIYVSPSEEKIRGYTLAELQQLSFRELLTFDSVQVALELFSTELPKALADPTYSPVITREFEYYSRDGSLHSVESKISLIRDENGKPTAILGQDRDISERKQMENELKAANIQLEAALAREQKLAQIDVLTGISNRRHLFELAELEFEIAMRYQQSLSVIMFDLDHFKKVNDSYGHAAGDQVLKSVTQLVCSMLRSADVFGRYGGEEFVILLPMTNAQEAYALAERIRKNVELLRVPSERGSVAVTLSTGIVELVHNSQPDTVESLIRDADSLMYSAKQAGRNRIAINA